jgi:hypothetical protein
MSTTLCSSNNKLLNQNYDIITKVLIYKQLNPPQYRVYKFDRGYLGTVLSKSVSLIFDVQGKGKINQFFVYDIKNKIVKYRQYYVSEEKRKQNMEKNRMRKKMKLLKKRRDIYEDK